MELFRDGVGGTGGNVQVLFAITDAGDGSDDCGGTDAESFLQGAGGMSGEDLLDGDGSLFEAHLHFAQKSEHGITRDTGENGAGKRRRDGDAVDDEHDV